jgi:hypothetical protein
MSQNRAAVQYNRRCAPCLRWRLTSRRLCGRLGEIIDVLEGWDRFTIHNGSGVIFDWHIVI